MNASVGVFKENRIEKTIEKSRFIAACAHTESEEEARAFVSRIRAEFPDATHVCYAFVADKTGCLSRFSDGGEPQGTAGVPILEAIRARKLFQTAAAVARYFGGVKLGAGGLARAYAGAAGECLDGAEKRCYELCARYEITLGYDLAEPVKKFVAANGGQLCDVSYADKVVLTAAVRERLCDAFSAKLADFTAGRAAQKKLDEYFYPFAPEKERE